MSATDANIYRLCRAKTRMSQELWAECLGISVESVKRYELGNSVPSNSVVLRMINISGYEALAVQHLINTSRSLDVLPSFKADVSLTQAAVQLINRVMDFADSRRDRQLLKIAEDGEITDDERPLFNDILEELQDIISAAYQVRYADDGGEAKVK